MNTKSEDFVLIGAGLPRTGTMSTRAALRQVLEGDVYHMETVGMERPDHHPLWRKALDGTITKQEWRTILRDYRGGVDYPISFFYKEIMEVFPNAKVLLNVRDPVKWYQSVHGSILQLMTTANSWPCTWFNSLMGSRDDMALVNDLSRAVPQCSTLGLGMFGAVEESKEKAIKFYEEHVEEVKNHVPKEKLLVWEVKEGWGPLCKFLDVAEPAEPFPRVNDTESIMKARKILRILSWLVVVVFPLTMFGLVLTNNCDKYVAGFILIGVMMFLRLLASAFKMSSSGAGIILNKKKEN